MTFGPVRFASEEQAATLNERGVPMSEDILYLEPGPCIRCGRTAEEGATEGLLEDAYVEAGVLKGKAICNDCLDVDETSGSST